MKPVRIALYALALLLPVGLLAVSQAQPVSFGARPPLMLFLFPVILCALLGGLGPGLLSTAMAAGPTAFFLMSPNGGVAAAGHDLAEWAMLVGNGVLVSLMSQVMFRARHREVVLEEERGQSESSFRAIFEQAAVGIAQVALNGRWLRVNDRFCEIVGYSREELLAGNPVDLTHPDDRVADRAYRDQLLAGEIRGFAREKRFMCKDGAIGWIHLSVTLVRDGAGAPSHFIAIIKDISEAKTLETVLHENEQHLAEANRLAGLGHWRWVLATDAHTWSEEIYRIYGRDPAQQPAVYPEVQQYFTAESWADLAAAVQQCLADGRSYERDAEVVRPDGTHAWITARGTAVRDATGKIVTLHGTLQDITARKEAERMQAALAQQQFQARRAALNLMEDAQAAQARAEAALTALRESEHRFRALVEQSLAGIYIIQDGRFRYVNPGFATMFGYRSADEIIEQLPVTELVMPEDQARVAEDVRQGADCEIGDLHFTFAGRRRDRSRIEVELHGRRFDHESRPAVIGLILDITARKAADDALRESELRFHDIVNASADWVWEVDAQGRYTYASESVRDLLGYGPEELLGMTPWDLMPRDEAARVSADFEAIVARKAPFRDLDNINLRKDGLQVHVASNGMPILDADGQLLGYRGLDRDITERKLADTRLAEREACYRAVIESTPDGFWMVDAQGLIQASNDAYARLSGYSLDDLVGMPIAQVEVQETQDEVRAHIERIMREGTAVFESQHRAKCGRIWPVEVTVSYWPAGGCMFAFLRDITGRKAAEAELKTRNEELERFNRATVGRELDMLEMKKTINALRHELGRDAPYPLAFLRDQTHQD